MWHQHPSITHRLVDARRQDLIAASERSRLRRTARRTRPQAVHRPTTRGTR